MKNTRDIERYTKDYIHSDNDFEAVMVHYRRQKVLEILHHYKPKRILEIGCGVQASFDFYQEYEKFVVVEPSKEFCKMISSSKHKNAKVSIINDFLENQIPTLEKQEFDFILLSSLLHELNSPLDFLKSLRKLCGEDTILHINVPNNKSFHLLWAYEAGLIKHIGQLTSTAVKMQQNSAFDAQSLAQIVQKAGFDINGGGGNLLYETL